MENTGGKRPALSWGRVYLATTDMIDMAGRAVKALIESAGCRGRMGSLVTDLDLGDHPLVAADELCLVKAGKCAASVSKLVPSTRYLRMAWTGPPAMLVCGRTIIC